MMRHFLLIFLLMGLYTATAKADIPYHQDPVYKEIHGDDQTPMDDIIDYAKTGDVRAQFILGDLYAKGKGGLPQNTKEARRWFEESASHGYAHSFIRLAALAKRENKPVEAWKWYTLAIDSLDDTDKRRFVINARRDLRLTEENADIARQAMKTWKSARDDRLRAEKKAANASIKPAQPSATGENKNE